MTNPFLNSMLTLRRRSVWEAADSGVLLWRRCFVFFIPFFALPLWVFACALRLLPGNFFYLSYLILWWLKPFFDRMVLHVISVSFFGASSTLGAGDLFRGSGKAVFRGLLGDLLWRRFSPNRAAFMPIRVLERIGGKQYWQRKTILAAEGLKFCSLLSVFGLALEVMLLLGEIIFTVMMLQVISPSAFFYIRDNIKIAEIVIFSAFCLNYFLAESLYVCMGFGLYINSRVEAEGWDLQILFRKFSGVPAILLLCFFLVMPNPLYAEGKVPADYFPQDFPLVREENMEALERILLSADFGGERASWGIRLKDAPKNSEIPEINLAPWMTKSREVIGFLLRLIIILAVSGFIFFTVFRLWNNRRAYFNGHGRSAVSYTNHLMQAESPEALFSKASDYYSRGFVREAWAACLSGCLGAFTMYHSVTFPPDATEYGCLDLVRAKPMEGFDSIVQSWVLFAYGGRIPGRQDFEQALAYGKSLQKKGGYDET